MYSLDFKYVIAELRSMVTYYFCPNGVLSYNSISRDFKSEKVFSSTKDFCFRILDSLPIPPLNLLEPYSNVTAGAGG